MADIAKLEGREIVIRVPVDCLLVAATHNGLVVTDLKALAPNFAAELSASGQDEDLYINKYLDEALVRCVESACPGVDFIDDTKER